MSRKFMPVGLMIIVLIAALAAVGVGYGLWFEFLHVGGHVQTGEVDIAIENVEKTELIGFPMINGDYKLVPEDEYVGLEGKTKEKVADCYVSTGRIKPWANVGNTEDDGANMLKVQVTGAYPSYHCKVDFDIKSLGNVPVHFMGPFELGPEWKDLELDCGDLTERQLHEGETAHCQLTVHFTNWDKVNENGNYCFAYHIFGYQFNEDGPAQDQKPLITDCSTTP